MISQSKFIGLLGLVIVVITSCSLFNPPADLSNIQSQPDETIIHSIDMNFQKSSTSTVWSYCETGMVDLSKYNKIDSIVFTPNMRSQLESEHCIVELYDFSNSKSIINSRVESTVRYTLHFGKSIDLLSTFPKSSKIGLRFRSSKKGHYVEIGIGSKILIYTHR